MAAQVVFIIPSVGAKAKTAAATSFVCGVPRIVRCIAEIDKVSAGASYVATDSDDVLLVCREHGIKAYRTFEDISNDLVAAEGVVKRLECINVIDDETLIVRIDPTSKWVDKQLVHELIQFHNDHGFESFSCVGVQVKDADDETDKSKMKVLVGLNSAPLMHSCNPIRINELSGALYENIDSYVYIVGIDAFSCTTLNKMLNCHDLRHPLDQAKEVNVPINVMSWAGVPPLHYDDNFTLRGANKLLSTVNEDVSGVISTLKAA
ncbi:hypothetical protein OTK49_01980 [Vibrio coralliirubri]|uniref:cytidylyltransferase domain-containing protein n=1 Tax=Vibrio coralliirubri TaxID=1516159 RepID=UPI002284BEAF|nr:hypothetical protein [Vibrio coralliirubri]MCY9861283.1 hypothetical protein [Vibrio coralliirubri]